MPKKEPVHEAMHDEPVHEAMQALVVRAPPPPGWRSKHHARLRPVRMMARKRAQQRWSALLARIAKQVPLAPPLWAAFVAHANKHYKPAFVAALARPRIKCVGPSAGGKCGFCVDLLSFGAFRTLGLLHLDHASRTSSSPATCGTVEARPARRAGRVG